MLWTPIRPDEARVVMEIIRDFRSITEFTIILIEQSWYDRISRYLRIELIRLPKDLIKLYPFDKDKQQAEFKKRIDQYTKRKFDPDWRIYYRPRNIPYVDPRLASVPDGSVIFSKYIYLGPTKENPPVRKVNELCPSKPRSRKSSKKPKASASRRRSKGPSKPQ
jgi:hypothetical protein